MNSNLQGGIMQGDTLGFIVRRDGGENSGELGTSIIGLRESYSQEKETRIVIGIVSGRVVH